MATEFLIPIALFALIYGVVYLFVRRRERLALIEKGIDASIFSKGSTNTESLKWGILFVGIGVGILLGKLFAAYSCLGEEASMFSMICLCGGLSLVIYHFLEKSIAKKENPE